VNYDRFPTIKAEGAAICGWDVIRHFLIQKIDHMPFTLVVDTYPGVNDEEILGELKKLKPAVLVQSTSFFVSVKEYQKLLAHHFSDDRVFGNMYYGKLTDFVDQQKLKRVRARLSLFKGLRIVYGVGASLVEKADLLVYLDLPRWEIQLRLRAGAKNFLSENGDEDPLRKFKRGFFVEWRLADKHKMQIFDQIDFFIDTTKENQPKLIDRFSLDKALQHTSQRPFRTVPYFDPGVWGGQWMKKVCGLDPEKPNYAWSFDGVPEENSLLFDFSGVVMEFPAMDLVLRYPRPLLGQQVYARFGAEFPIRFDFLDTMGGQNLSLQVHPLTEYIKKEFGMPYTQDESYYILDAKKGAHVYLGLKEGVDKEEMFAALKRANEGKSGFDAEQYVNKFPVKKHDHMLIPAGTVHCSGADTMVLEISATPYFFTFKMWDWDRLGLDGKPRPVHLQHAKHNVQFDRTTKWVKANLVNQIYEIEEGEGKVEHTGLHSLEFIETRRYSVEQAVTIDNNHSVSMCNLVDGKAALITSPANAFEPFVVHYAETFIVPAAIDAFTIAPQGCKKIKLIRANVR